jgi:hypothetical protein
MGSSSSSSGSGAYTYEIRENTQATRSGTSAEDKEWLEHAKETEFDWCTIISSPVYHDGVEAGRIWLEIVTAGLAAIARATAGNGRHWLLVLQSKWTYKEKNFYMGIHKNDKGVRWMASPNYDDMKHMVDVEGYGKIKTEHPWAQIRPKSFQKWDKIMTEAYNRKHHKVYSLDGSNCQHFALELYKRLT